jgi:hypothetical protein
VSNLDHLLRVARDGRFTAAQAQDLAIALREIVDPLNDVADLLDTWAEAEPSERPDAREVLTSTAGDLVVDLGAFGFAVGGEE